MSRNERFVKDYIESLEYQDAVALDIGANHGIYTKLLSDKFKSVFAFEPHPDNIVKINNHVDKDNVIVKDSVIGTVNDKVKLYTNRNPGGHSIVKELTEHSKWGHRENEFIEVESVTLNTFYSQHSDEQIGFIKCDIEGGEKDIFFYGEDLLKNNKINIVLETHQVNFDWNILIEYFNDLGYNVYDDKRRPTKIMKYDSHYLISNLMQ